jgi:hypothetical protein
MGIVPSSRSAHYARRRRLKRSKACDITDSTEAFFFVSNSTVPDQAFDVDGQAFSADRRAVGCTKKSDRGSGIIPGIASTITTASETAAPQVVSHDSAIASRLPGTANGQDASRADLVDPGQLTAGRV